MGGFGEDWVTRSGGWAGVSSNNGNLLNSDYALLQSFDRAIGISLSDYRSCFKMEFMQCGGLVFAMFGLFGKDASGLLSTLSSPTINLQPPALNLVYWIVTTLNYKIPFSEQHF